MNFIDQVRAEEGIVQFTAAFAEQSLYVPFFAEPAQCSDEIDLFFAGNVDNCAKIFQ